MNRHKCLRDLPSFSHFYCCFIVFFILLERVRKGIKLLIRLYDYVC